MLGELVEVDPLDPAAARWIGAPVELAWSTVDTELTLPCWRLGAGR
jgi:hypothetical protein